MLLVHMARFGALGLRVVSTRRAVRPLKQRDGVHDEARRPAAPSRESDKRAASS
jgi:hypothetical protein